MPEITGIEREFKINVSAPDFDIARGLDVAMQVEERSRKFYSELARKSAGPMRIFMKFLSEQEAEHKAMLEDVKSSLKSMKLWIRVPASKTKEPLKDLSAFRMHPGDEHIENQEEISAVLKAMGLEKQTREFYMRFSESVSSPEGKAFFRALADWEKTHFDLLSGIYNSLSYVRLET